MLTTKEDLKKALRKAKSDFQKGYRHYDQKHKTHSPTSWSENILEHVSDLVGGHGVEGYHPGDSNPMRPKYLYINSGDSYQLTLVFNRATGKFTFSDIGSIIEKEEF